MKKNKNYNIKGEYIALTTIYHHITYSLEKIENRSGKDTMIYFVFAEL